MLPKLKFLDALPIRDEEIKESFHSGFVALTWKHLRKEMVSSTLIGITFANLTHLFSYSVIINSASFQNINPNIRTLSVLQRKGYGTESWNTFTLGNFQKAIDLSQTLICDIFLSSPNGGVSDAFNLTFSLDRVIGVSDWCQISLRKYWCHVYLWLWFGKTQNDDVKSKRHFSVKRNTLLTFYSIQCVLKKISMYLL